MNISSSLEEDMNISGEVPQYPEEPDKFSVFPG